MGLSMTRYRVEVEKTFRYELHLDADTEEDAANAAVESRQDRGLGVGLDPVRGIRSRLMETRIEIRAIGEVIFE